MATDFDVKKAAYHIGIRTTLDSIFSDITSAYSKAASEDKIVDGYLARISAHCSRLKKPANRGPILRLNVGGRNFDINESSVAQVGQQHSILNTMYVSNWTHRFVRNKGDRIFLNVNPKWMEVIVSPLRIRHELENMKQPAPKMNEEHNCGLNAIITYYKMGTVFADRKIILSPLLSNISCMNALDSAESLFSYLSPEFPTKDKLTSLTLHLLYRGSRDGFDPADFMLKCGGKADTVCVIEDTQGNVFGGYGKNPWTNNSTLIQNSVLFALSGPIAPHKLDLRQTYQYYNETRSSPQPTTASFSGAFLHIHQKVGVTCQSNFKHQGNPTPPPTPTYFSGSIPNFTVREMEVYAIERPPVSEIAPEMTWGGLLHPLLPLISSAVGGGEISVSLLYSSSRDGLSCAGFHAAIDGKHRTLMIARDAFGQLFGSFCELVTPGDLTNVPDLNSSFVFSLGSIISSPKVEKIVTHHVSSQFYCNFGPLLMIHPSNQIHQLINASAYYQQNNVVTEIVAFEVIGKTEQILGQDLESKISQARSSLDETFHVSTEELRADVEKKVLDLKEKQANLLTELLWVEHLSAPPVLRDIDVGLLRKWLAISDRVKALAALDSRTEIMAAIEKAMDRLGVPREGTGEILTDVKTQAEIVHDEVVSYNVGGTIIAVLKSTLLRQAPDSTFAARFSGRWDKSGAESEPDDIEDGHICLVRLHSSCIPHLLLLYLIYVSHNISCIIHLLAPLCVLQYICSNLHGMHPLYVHPSLSLPTCLQLLFLNNTPLLVAPYTITRANPCLRHPISLINLSHLSHLISSHPLSSYLTSFHLISSHSILSH